MEIDEVRALAEQKNKKKTAKNTAKSPSVKKSNGKEQCRKGNSKKGNGSEKRNHQNDGAACPFWGQYSR